ncbi:hypothetical protein EYF80_066128 [Liparis tanakae]|uniref:Uncharacterized protein n=1 Tax=Liparis tanakae TaxID=230148 RepID=A0A4Z2E586_9TELE|nr:hypothetical protein EYF80_066128 [Liparis tanakae]
MDHSEMVPPTGPESEDRSGLESQWHHQCYGFPPMAASISCLSGAAGMSGVTPSRLLWSMTLCCKEETHKMLSCV